MNWRAFLAIGAIVITLTLGAIQDLRRPRGASVPPSEGITRALATDRAQKISGLRYDLALVVPESSKEPVRGRETIRFTLSDPSRGLVLDFAQPAEKVTFVGAGGRKVPVSPDSSINGHLVIPAAALRQGENILEIEFLAGDESLNRNDEYLYSLFVPARASAAIPCFDQPDLKGVFALTLEVPAGWQVIANGAERERATTGGRTVVSFEPTDPIPTYLFGFAAGKFSIERAKRDGRTFRMFHRETDQAKVARNRDAIFDLHAKALIWLEDYTGRSYPFGKFDFVLIPAFQFGGMEHPGAVYYNATAQLLDETATQEQMLARASTIAHETAHMWFGDLVTMKWFDDVWLKEVFANLMAAKIVNPSFPAINHELRFLIQHYPAAYSVDRTAGANPVRQTLDNLSEAGSLYGAIIYDKAPIVMRQLETILGEGPFREGLREYLRRYEFGNATWSDLIQILDERTAEDLAAWSHAWVDEPGRPAVRTDLDVGEGRVRNLSLVQTDPRGRSMTWTQRLEVALGYDSGARFSPVTLASSSATVAAAAGEATPRFILPNGKGLGYGLFELDPASRGFLVERLPEILDPLTRGAAWITLWDEMLERRIAPTQLMNLALRALPRENEEQNVQLILGYLSGTYWLFLSEQERHAFSVSVEAALRKGLADAKGTSLKAAYFASLRRVVQTPEGIRFLERAWRTRAAVPGLTFAETDYTAMALELAVRDVPGAQQILDEQLARITNPDRKERLAFIMPALSGNEATRDRFFSSLADAANRRHEPWVVDAMAYLNHALRATRAERYIRPSLDLLREIQRTGDIFFPTRWIDAALSGHHSPTAAEIVRDFLSSQPDYPPRLRQIIQREADTLFRASEIVGGR